jgi:hypothetical protein
MGEVADLFASLGTRVDAASFAKGDAALARAKKSVDELDDRRSWLFFLTATASGGQITGAA